MNEKEEEGYVFAGSGLRGIVLPATLKEIPQNSFWKCENLRSVRFAEGLEQIGLSAFQESGLESVTLPCSLRMVAQAAFCSCSSLRTAEFGEGLETLGAEED